MSTYKPWPVTVYIYMYLACIAHTGKGTLVAQEIFGNKATFGDNDLCSNIS